MTGIRGTDLHIDKWDAWAPAPTRSPAPRPRP